jgi:hypothetical protein
MIRELDERTGHPFSAIVGETFGRCPTGCSGGRPEAVVYRSSKRSVTLRCNGCGLLWTMTVHQMAKAARTNADRAPTDGAEHGEVGRYRAELLGYWSEMIDDKRGRGHRRTRFFERPPPAPAPEPDVPPRTPSAPEPSSSPSDSWTPFA